MRKGSLALILVAALGLCSSTAMPSENILPVANNQAEFVEKCSGTFKIDGKKYTITLHDVDLWTCIKFKVGSWFK